jgi:hypothetical protein
VNWREHISQAYATYSVDKDYLIKPVFREPAPQDVMLAAEQSVGSPFTEELRDLLSQTDGFGEEMILKEGRLDVDLGPYIFRASEIAEFTNGFRQSKLTSNIAFQEMIFIGTPHADGIFFALRRGESAVYAWYPMDRAFQPLAANLQDFIFGWLSGALSI